MLSKDEVEDSKSGAEPKQNNYSRGSVVEVQAPPGPPKEVVQIPNEDLDVSMSSLMSHGANDESPSSELHKMAKSMSYLDAMRPDEFLPSSGIRGQRTRFSTSKHQGHHKAVAHDRPEDWLGGGQKAGRKSWTAKRVLEVDDSGKEASESAAT